MIGRAALSSCGTYRYSLSREWGDVLRRCLFVMLNPSVADHEINDATIRVVVGFARRWGFGAADVGNLYALRSTDPRALLSCQSPVGGGNTEHLSVLARRASRIVVAWGNWGSIGGRGADVYRDLRHWRQDLEPLCLGITRSGQPRHPLRIRSDFVPVPWSPA